MASVDPVHGAEGLVHVIVIVGGNLHAHAGELEHRGVSEDATLNQQVHSHRGNV
jgi:hypothetical protein